MSVLKVADFYYGAFLSALLNYAGKKPSLFDEIPKSNDRRIYRLTTQNNPRDYIIYTKYVAERKNKNDEFAHWIFPFSQEEIQKLAEFETLNYNVMFAFICVKSDLKDCELALVDYKDVMDCIGVKQGIKGKYRINIKAINGKHGLRMYGSGRSDKVHGQDNTLRVPRDSLKNL